MEIYTKSKISIYKMFVSLDVIYVVRDGDSNPF